MNIWAPKIEGSACTKIPYKGFEISIAMDDSCGAFTDYIRSSIAVFREPNGPDITPLFFTWPDQLYLEGDAETLKWIFARIDQLIKDRP